ncbi:MAG: radical SAM protein [Acidobacteria bacterium]|nr:MAG: radical SAM protein [Acidobacteriota bacterium]
MSILLTHGYFLGEDAHERAIMRPYPPLGILYLSAWLKSKGFQTHLLDNTFSHREDFPNEVRRLAPGVVGIYSNLMTRGSVLGLITSCRQLGLPVIVGGPDPANYPAEYLAHGADVVVIGEGEKTLEELLPFFDRRDPGSLDKVNGIVFKRGDEIVRTPPRQDLVDLDGLPFPDRPAIRIDDYLDTWRKHHGRGAVSLVTSRGCPYTCTWCSHSVFGYTYRLRNPVGVADEVELILADYKPELLWYADDVFTLNHRWLKAYSSELKRRSICVPFETISREDRLDEDVVRILAEMGCCKLWIGAESGSQAVLDAMSRRTDAARLPEVVSLLSRYGIKTGMFVMFGYEGEELEDIEKTLAMLKACRPDSFLTTVAYPIKGTPYYDLVADRVILSKPWSQGSDRDFTVRGRHSKRFYRFANSWVVGEMARSRLAEQGSGNYLKRAKALARSTIGRLGMTLTRGEKEG